MDGGMMVKRKAHQTPHKMNQRLNTIWRSGDRDEGSFKHVLYGIKALFSGKSWVDAKDYRMGKTKKTSFGIPFGATTRKKWGKIEKIRDELGDKEFRKLIYETPDWGESIGIYTKEK